jgi:predicted acetyltransferase
MSRQIREVRGEEAFETSRLLTNYAFGSGPPDTATLERWRSEAEQPASSDDGPRVLVAFVDGRAVATVTGQRLVQNVRGRVMSALGVAGVTTHPDARRGGHVRALLAALHQRALDDGDLVSALYPFRPSFYARFGYIGLPMRRSVRLYPAGMDELRRLDTDVTVSLHRSDEADAWKAYLSVEDAWLRNRHGLMVESSTERRQAAGAHVNCYLALARDGEQVIGAMAFRTISFGGELRALRFLADSARARIALLRWLSGHGDQYGEFSLPLPPGSTPELWFTDVACTDGTETSVPKHGAPMARLLDASALSGLAVGPAQLVVAVTGDDYVDGTWLLDGRSGRLELQPTDRSPDATLSVAGLSGLVYGVAGPDDVAVRQLGSFTAAGAEAAATLFPRQQPYLLEEF